jgi:hypothetical protein
MLSDFILWKISENNSRVRIDVAQLQLRRMYLRKVRRLDRNLHLDRIRLEVDLNSIFDSSSLDPIHEISETKSI